VEPVRIKWFGLIPMTKTAYLVTTAITGGVVVILVLFLVTLGIVPFRQLPWDPALAPFGLDAWVWNWWTLGLLVVLEAFDVLITLRQFARREAEQRVRHAERWPGDRPPDEHIRAG
jgi:hypothetical protein